MIEEIWDDVGNSSEYLYMENTFITAINPAWCLNIIAWLNLLCVMQAPKSYLSL